MSAFTFVTHPDGSTVAYLGDFPFPLKPAGAERPSTATVLAHREVDVADSHQGCSPAASAPAVLPTGTPAGAEPAPLPRACVSPQPARTSARGVTPSAPRAETNGRPPLRGDDGRATYVRLGEERTGGGPPLPRSRPHPDLRTKGQRRRRFHTRRGAARREESYR